MMIRRKLAAILFAASLLSVPGPALSVTQQGEPIYHIYYFDAPNGSVVGTHFSDCTYWGVVTHAWLVGEVTEYAEPLLAGYCRNGIWEPL